MGPRSKAPALESALRNSQKLPNIVLELQAEFTPGQVRKLKEFYKDFFDVAPVANDAKALGQETEAKLKATRSEIADLLAEALRYPFVKALEPSADSADPRRRQTLRLVSDGPRAARRRPPRPQGERVRPDQAVSRRKPEADLRRGGRISGPQQRKSQLRRARRAPRRSRILADPTCFKSGVTAKLKTELDGLRAESTRPSPRRAPRRTPNWRNCARRCARCRNGPRSPAAEKACDRGGLRRGGQPVRSASVIGLVKAQLDPLLLFAMFPLPGIRIGMVFANRVSQEIKSGIESWRLSDISDFKMWTKNHSRKLHFVGWQERPQIAGEYFNFQPRTLIGLHYAQLPFHNAELFIRGLSLLGGGS